MLYEKLRPGPGRSAAEVGSHQRTRLHDAMIEIAAESGYGAVTVRGLTRLAGVSTHSFYELFGDKEACFLDTHEQLVFAFAGRMIKGQQAGVDWRERLRLGLLTLTQEIAAEPKQARLILAEAFAVGPPAHERLTRARAIFESVIRSSLTREPGGIAAPAFVVSAIVAGVTQVACARLLAGRGEELPELVDDLMDWALSYTGGDFESSQSQNRWESAAFSPGLELGIDGTDDLLYAAGDERTLILSAVAKLAARDGYRALSASGIRTVAGVSRKSFDASFDDVESCFLEAVELHCAQAVAAAGRYGAEADDWLSGLHRAVAALCARAGRDPVFLKLVFSEILAAGCAGLRCRQRLIALFAEQLRSSAPPGHQPTKVVAQASVGAAWAILHDQITADRSMALSQQAASVTFLLLAPATACADLGVSSGGV